MFVPRVPVSVNPGDTCSHSDLVLGESICVRKSGALTMYTTAATGVPQFSEMSWLKASTMLEMGVRGGTSIPTFCTTEAQIPQGIQTLSNNSAFTGCPDTPHLVAHTCHL